MTIPKFEPVAEVLWYDPALRHTPEPAGKIIDGSMSFIESADIGTQLYTADQLTEAYEAGKRDAIPEGWVLVPKEPTEEMLRAPWLKIDEQTSFKLKTAHNYYKAMLAAAPKGEE